MQDSVALSLSQFVGAWKTLCSAEPGHHVESAPGIELVFGMLPIPFFNVVFLTEALESPEQLRAAASQAKAMAAPREIPWFLVTTHEWIRDELDAPAVLAELGLVPAMPLTGMMAETVDPAGATPDSLTLVRPASNPACQAILDVNGAAYGMGPMDFPTAMSSPAYWERHFPVLGYAEDRAVAASATLLVDGYRYVAFVATDPQFQKRGFANAAMRHSLDLAAKAHGPLPSVLHATDAGAPVYAKMGYKPISHHTCFLEERFTH
jgi:ribosomal protein S18 acetylase RimI-like enzyme